MKRSGQLDALLLAWVVSCVIATRSRSFLAQPEIQSEAVAEKLVSIEHDWQAQVAIFIQCEQGDKLANHESCGKNEGLFTQSCTAISNAFVSGQGGNSRAVTSFMDGVCAGKALEGWQRDTCLSFRGELLAGIATAQDAKLNADGICQRLWVHLVDREKLLSEDSKKDQEIMVLKKELAETQTHVAKTSEEQQHTDAAAAAKPMAEADQVVERALELQAEALNKAQQQQQQQQQQQDASEKQKQQAAEGQRQHEIEVQQEEQAALEKHKEEELAAKQKEAAQRQRQQEAEKQRKEAVAAERRRDEQKKAAKRQVQEAAERLRKKKAAEHQEQQHAEERQEASARKQVKESTRPVATQPTMQQHVQQVMADKVHPASKAERTLQASNPKAGPVVTHHAVSTSSVPTHDAHKVVGNKTQSKESDMRNIWQKHQAERMAKWKKLKQSKKQIKINATAAALASEEKRKLAELRAAQAQAALEKAMHTADQVSKNTEALRKKRILQEINDRKQLAAEARERRIRKRKEAKERHEKAERDRLAYEADLKKRKETKAVYPLTKSLVNATSWEHHPKPQEEHPAAPAPEKTVPSHVPKHSVAVTDHTPVSEGAGAKRAMSAKMAEPRRQAAAVAAAPEAAEAKAKAHSMGSNQRLKASESPTVAPQQATHSQPTVASQKATHSQQKVAAKRVVAPKATVSQQRANGSEALLKASSVQQPNAVISAAKKPSLPIKALHQAASTVKVATQASKIQTVHEARTGKKTVKEQKEKAHEAVTAIAEKAGEALMDSVVKLADNTQSGKQGSDGAADNEGQDDNQSEQESEGQGEGEDKEESQNQDDSEVHGKAQTESTQSIGDEASASVDSQGGDAAEGNDEQNSEHSESNNKVGEGNDEQDSEHSESNNNVEGTATESDNGDS